MDAPGDVRTDGTLSAALERTEREAVESVLARTHGNVAEAAAVLDIARTSLYRIMKRFGITSRMRAKAGLPRRPSTAPAAGGACDESPAGDRSSLPGYSPRAASTP